jgi:lambda family phage tail tape measure protein
VDPYQDQIQSLRQLNEELRIRAQNQGVQEQGMLIELELARQGIEVTNEQRRQIAGLLFDRQKLTEEIQKQQSAEEGLFEEAKRNEQLVERMIQRVEATKQLSAQQEILNRRFQEGAVDLETYLQITEQLTLQGLEASKTFGDGFTRAFIKIKQEAEDLASVAEKVVNVFADQATDAIVNFVETGKFSFQEFADAVVKDLLRIITRLLVVQALNAAFGGVGGGLGLGGAAAGALAGSRQEGGTVQPGRSYLVGENGPEIFHPERTGSVEPNPKDQPAPKPEVKVQVVNVQDPNEIPQTISSGRADDSIINALARNKDKVKQVVQ